jgi:hypothetical protein
VVNGTSLETRTRKGPKGSNPFTSAHVTQRREWARCNALKMGQSRLVLFEIAVLTEDGIIQ